MAYQVNSQASLDNNPVTEMTAIKYLRKKQVSKYIAGLTLVGVLGFSAPKIASAEGLNIRLNKNDYESRVSATFNIPVAFPWEGENTKYASRNKNLENLTQGLTQTPSIKASDSGAYFKKYDGNWFTKFIKEFVHGATTPLHHKNTKVDGTKRWLPGYSTITKEGSIFAPIHGIFASLINGTSKLCRSKYRVYSAWEKNFFRTLGTFALKIGAGMALSSGGGGSSSNTTTTNTESDPYVPPPAEKPPAEDPPADDTPPPADDPPAEDPGDDGTDL